MPEGFMSVFANGLAKKTRRGNQSQIEHKVEELRQEKNKAEWIVHVHDAVLPDREKKKINDAFEQYVKRRAEQKKIETLELSIERGKIKQSNPYVRAVLRGPTQEILELRKGFSRSAK